MKNTILSLLMISSLWGFAQNSKLKMEVYISDADSSNTENAYYLLVINKLDTLLSKSLDKKSKYELESLKPGFYKIQVFKSSTGKAPYFVKNINLFPSKITEVYIDLSIDESHTDIDTLTGLPIVKVKYEGQINYTYYKTDWINSSSIITTNFGLGVGGSTWFAFSKHLGFISGGGIGFSQHYFSNDTLLHEFAGLKKVNEHYNYIDGRFEMKFRFSSGNQQKPFGKTNSVILDVGALYKLPLLFREVGRYEDNKKFINKRLHQFTDLRAFVNVGYSPLVFFMEYRLSDFLIGKYTEIPKYSMGIKLMIH